MSNDFMQATIAMMLGIVVVDLIVLSGFLLLAALNYFSSRTYTKCSRMCNAGIAQRLTTLSYVLKARPEAAALCRVLAKHYEDGATQADYIGLTDRLEAELKKEVL